MKKYSIKLYSTFPQKRLVWMKSQHWFPKTFHGWSGLMFIQGLAAVQFLIKIFPQSMRFGFLYSRENECSWFWSIEEQRRVRRIIIDKMKHDRSFVAGVKREWSQAWEKFNAFSEKVLTSPLASLSHRELSNLYRQIVWLAIGQARYGYLVESLHIMGDDNWFQREVEGAAKMKVPDEAIILLSSPVTPSFSQEERWSRVDLLKLSQTKRNRERLNKALERHCQKFTTIQGNYFSAPLLDPQEVKKSLSKLSTLKVVQQKRELKLIREKKKKLIQAYRLQPLVPLIRAMEFFIHMQDYRKWAVMKVNASIFKIIDELSRRTGISREILLEATPNEIIFLTDGKLFDIKKIKDRRKGVLCWDTKDGVSIFTGPKIQKFPLHIFYGAESHNGELKGSVAMRGFAKGRVRIVKSQHDIRIFKKGEILVTNNTTPEFVPAMKRAAAIVTEQGGITIHAAIISRELGVPCVIGTKIATKVLKNGDLVEVDARRGVISTLRSS